MKKVLITGAFGMLGTTLTKEFREKAYEVIQASSLELDITDESSINMNINKHRPDIIINSAAYTNVDLAETEKELAMLVNATAVGNLARECLSNNIKFIHIGTDYVFGDNDKNGHSEDDEPGNSQLNHYGKTKREGEILALKNNPDSYIVRTSWIFGPNGRNFVDTMLNLAKTKTELTIVDDEFGAPTYTKDVASQIHYIVEKDLKPGFYHAVSEGMCSRFEEAQKIFELANVDIKLNKMKLADYKRAAKTANYSILKNTKLPKLQNWDSAVGEYISTLTK